RSEPLARRRRASPRRGALRARAPRRRDEGSRAREGELGRPEGTVGRARLPRCGARGEAAQRSSAGSHVAREDEARGSVHREDRGGPAMKRFVVVVVALVALLFAPRAWAHKPSDSYLTLEVDGTTIHGRWDIALRDLDYALDLDADGDGKLTWGEVKSHVDE